MTFLQTILQKIKAFFFLFVNKRSNKIVVNSLNIPINENSEAQPIVIPIQPVITPVDITTQNNIEVLVIEPVLPPVDICRD